MDRIRDNALNPAEQCVTVPRFDCRSSETVAPDGDGVVGGVAVVERPSPPPANDGVD